MVAIGYSAQYRVRACYKHETGGQPNVRRRGDTARGRNGTPDVPLRFQQSDELTSRIAIANLTPFIRMRSVRMRSPAPAMTQMKPKLRLLACFVLLWNVCTYSYNDTILNTVSRNGSPKTAAVECCEMGIGTEATSVSRTEGKGSNAGNRS